MVCFEECEDRLVCGRCAHNHQNKLSLDKVLMKLEKYASISDTSLKKHLSLVGFMLEKLKYIDQFKKNIFNLQSKLQK